ncbi:MAG: N-acetyltransferase [Anaerolineaceae bacterium]|nr:N-acetyltransferase [Anaerolineaceae bacterium]
MIRDVHFDDAQRITDIYNPYILNTIITFEEIEIPASEIRQRIANVTSKGLPWIVYETGDGIIGYAYASPWRTRSAYRFSVETTIYLDQNFTDRGYGKELYATLLERLRRMGIHAAIAGISLPKLASLSMV